MAAKKKQTSKGGFPFTKKQEETRETGAKKTPKKKGKK